MRTAFILITLMLCNVSSRNVSIAQPITTALEHNVTSAWLPGMKMRAQETTMKALADEARALKSERPDEWRAREEKLEGFFTDYVKATFPWYKRSMPPKPEFATLNLPLAFLATQLIEHPETESERSAESHYRYIGIIEAIIKNEDTRRVRFLEEYSESVLKSSGRYDETDWNRILARAADLKWGSEKLRETLHENPLLHRSALEYQLIDRFGSNLPNDVRASAYDYVDRQSRAKKLYVEAHEYWRLLFELNIKDAQDDFAARFAHSLPDRETLQELIKLAVPSERITKAIT